MKLLLLNGQHFVERRNLPEVFLVRNGVRKGSGPYSEVLELLAFHDGLNRGKATLLGVPPLNVFSEPPLHKLDGFLPMFSVGTHHKGLATDVVPPTEFAISTPLPWRNDHFDVFHVL